MPYPSKQVGFRKACNRLFAFACLTLLAGTVRAAYISELDLGGPAGKGIELSNVDPDTDYTVLFMSASPTSTFLFGLVLDVLHVPAAAGRAGVAMVTDTPWPGQPTLTVPLNSLGLASGDESLPLNNDLLLVVMSGPTDLARFNNPVTDSVAGLRYDEAAVTDWLVLSSQDNSATYESNFDVSAVNAELGIDLLRRLVVTTDAEVIGRANLPNESIDMDTFYAGEPDEVSRQFDVDGQYVYTYTPGMSNLPLAAHLPEPGSLLVLAVGSVLCLQRCRRAERNMH